MASSPDIVVIGSGMGGATVAAGLADTGASILILERGERLEPGNGERSTRAIFVENRFRTREQWRDGNGRPFNPGNFYYVGGNSKMYGAALFRFRREDFEARAHPGACRRHGPFPTRSWSPGTAGRRRSTGCAGASARTRPSRPTRRRTRIRRSPTNRRSRAFANG